MKLMPTGSPLVGLGNVIVSARSGRACMSYSAASDLQALAVLGCVVGSSTAFPSIHRWGACDRSRSRTAAASRTGIDTGNQRLYYCVNGHFTDRAGRDHARRNAYGE